MCLPPRSPPGGQQEAPHLVQFGLGQRPREAPRRGGVLLQLGQAAHVRADRADPLVGQHGVDDGSGQRLALGQLVPDLVADAAHGLHRDQADAGLVTGVHGLVQPVLGAADHRVVAHHDRVEEAAFGGGLQELRGLCVVAGEADEADLAAGLELLGDLLELLAAGPGQSLLAVLLVAHAVHEEQIDVVGLEGPQADIDVAEHQGQVADVVLLRVRLGDQEDLLAPAGPLEPPGDLGLAAAVGVAAGRVEVPDPHVVGMVEEALTDFAAGAQVQDSDLGAGLAQDAGRQRFGRLRGRGAGGRGSAGRSGGGGCLCRLQHRCAGGQGGGSCARLEQIATTDGRIAVHFRHQSDSYVSMVLWLSVFTDACNDRWEYSRRQCRPPATARWNTRRTKGPRVPGALPWAG